MRVPHPKNQPPRPKIVAYRPLTKKIKFLPKPEVVFKIEKNGNRNRFVLLQRPYIPNFKSLGHMVRPRDSFKIN